MAQPMQDFCLASPFYRYEHVQNAWPNRASKKGSYSDENVGWSTTLSDL